MTPSNISPSRKYKSWSLYYYSKTRKILPKNTEKIIVKNVLYELATALTKIYPKADVDYPDLTLKKPSSKKYNSVKFGNNVLVGKNVKIGKNSIIGANSVVEKMLSLGKLCDWFRCNN